MAYKNGEDRDFLYEDGHHSHHWNVKGFDVSDSESEFDFEGFQCNEDHDYIYEDENGHNFKGFDVDSDFDFEGFHCNEWKFERI